VDSPQDIALDEIKVEPAVAPPGGNLTIRAAVRATGEVKADPLVSFKIDNDTDRQRLPEKKVVRLRSSEVREVVCDRPAPIPTPGSGETAFQITAKLEANDGLPYNNSRFVTVLVRESRQLLTVTDSAASARIWRVALQAARAFSCEVKSPE